jgi:low affinity Fe/Cu permease
MVFVIQNTQNRDTAALHIKIDELILTSAASNKMLDLDSLDEKELEKLKRHYAELSEEKIPAAIERRLEAPKRNSGKRRRTAKRAPAG